MGPPVRRAGRWRWCRPRLRWLGGTVMFGARRPLPVSTRWRGLACSAGLRLGCRLISDGAASLVSSCQVAIREAGRAALWEPSAAPGRGLGRALYAAAWYCLHLGHFATWLQRKTANRRWAPGSGGAPLPSLTHGWAPGLGTVAICGHSPGGAKDLRGVWVCWHSCLGYPVQGRRWARVVCRLFWALGGW